MAPSIRYLRLANANRFLHRNMLTSITFTANMRLIASNPTTLPTAV